MKIDMDAQVYNNSHLSLTLSFCLGDPNGCDANHDVCEHTCHNSNDSFYCTCTSGYRLADNGRTCYEIDECSEGLSLCNQLCNNIVSSYYCTCFDGFQLSNDNHTCQQSQIARKKNR
jgi:hypothetical protein